MAYRGDLWRSGGYRSYYDYRVHDYGRIPADRPALRGEDRAEAAGHRGPAELARAIRSGRIVDAEVRGIDRGSRGRYKGVEVSVTDTNGRTRTYRLTGREATVAKLRQVGKRMDRKGIPAAWYPLDLARRPGEDEEEEREDEEDEEEEE